MNAEKTEEFHHKEKICRRERNLTRRRGERRNLATKTQRNQSQSGLVISKLFICVSLCHLWINLFSFFTPRLCGSA